MAYRQGQISKYRNYKAAPLDKKFHIENLHNISTTCPSESELIQANSERVAVPLNKPGGKIAIFELSKPGRQQGGVIPALVHGTKVNDFMWDPFDPTRLVVGCDDGRLWVWIIPKGGLDESTNTPEYTMNAHSEKIYFLRFHPLAANVLATGSHDSTIRIWDLSKQAEMILIQIPVNHLQVYCFAWSPCGSKFAAAFKDGKVRIYEPRQDTEPILEGQGPPGVRGGRVVWVLDGKYIVAVGFDRSSERQVHMYCAKDLKKLTTISLDSSPTILIPFYDEDSSVLLLSGRGDVTIFAFDIIEDPPFLRQLGHHRCSGAHLGISYLKKNACDIKSVEFARGIRLTESAIEPWSFTVPRVKSDYFQEDLFPPTKCLWEPTMDSSEWFAGQNVRPKRICLKPLHMKSTSILPETRWRSNSKSCEAERSIDDEKSQNLETKEPESEEVDRQHEIDEVKKAVVPEPLPRKKSLSSSGNSSSDEIGSDGGSRPVPRPRFKTNAAPALRTPSSFLAKRVSLRGSSTEDEENVNGLPSYDEAVGMGKNTSSFNNGNHIVADSISNGNSGSKNGSETRENSETQTGSNSEQDEAEAVSQKTRTVAERLKMYQSQSTDENVKNFKQGSLENQRGRFASREKTPEMEGGKIAQREQTPEKEATKSKFDGNKPEKESGNSRQYENTPERELSKTAAPFSKPERKIIPPDAHPVTATMKTEDEVKEPVKTSGKRIDTVFGQVSKYRNFKATLLHKKFHIENLRNVSTTCPSESELIQANPDRIAIPLNTPGGKLAIFEISRPGRQADGVIPALVHGTKVMDFMWDPFDNSRLLTGCDDGRICIWRIPEGGILEQTNEPEYSIYAHAEKIFFVRFHPLAQDVLASGSYDLTIRIWDLRCREARILIQLENSQIQIFSFAWSPCGSKFATACKDGKLRVYKPREFNNAVLEASGPPGVRGGRVMWVLDGKFLIVAGFDRSSERQLHMYSSADLNKVFTTSLDVSPAILVPFYDEDSSILLLSGRGDSTIFSFDVMEESPFLCKLSEHRFGGSHQGISFLKKNAVDVRNVEFAKGWRLTESAIEPWSFTVPRVKNEFFQDDLFPPTKCLWEPTMSSDEWFNGETREPRRVSLKPASMKSVVEVNFSNNASDLNSSSSKIPETLARGSIDSESEKVKAKEAAYQLEEAIKSKMVLNMKLEQDSMEGVDEAEWD